MPLTEKGREIMAAMKSQYGAEAGERVFYASKNAGTITGVDAASPLDRLPRVVSLSDLNAKNQTYWGAGVFSIPPSSQ